MPALVCRPHQVVDARAEVAIVRDGVVSHWHSWGVRDRELDVPVGDDTIWWLYSMTKPVTGVAMMTLYERGYFQLDARSSAGSRSGRTGSPTMTSRA